MLSVATVNVNGIRAAFRRGMGPWLRDRDPDVLLMQEVRASDEVLREQLGDDWYVAHAEPALDGHKGRAGVAVASRRPIKASRSCVVPDRFDGCGRWVEADLVLDDGSTLTAISTYVFTGEFETPPRQAEKYAFLDAITVRLDALRAEGRHVLMCGDLNIAHREVDLKAWKANRKKSGFLPEERAWLDSLFDDGWVDIGRRFGGEGPGPYTWWSWRGKAFDHDAGWRIDYQIASPGLGAAATGCAVDRAPAYANGGATTRRCSRRTACECGLKARIGTVSSTGIGPDAGAGVHAKVGARPDERGSPMTTTAPDLQNFDGHLLSPGDPDYDLARTVWNGMVDRRPDVIARCTSAADVTAAIRFARQRDLEIGIRCGGHSILGMCVPDGGMMLDLSPMGAARVDPERRTAYVQGGALLGALDQASVPHGLATTAGNVSHTGVGGLTLGGGMGWLARERGLSCDNVTGFELVTADGERVRADAEENPELFWGLQGGGGNFGVVTEFEFALHPTPNQALVVELFHPIDRAEAVLRGWRDLNAEAPRNVTFCAWVGELDGTPVANAGFVWIGDPDDARPLLDELRTLGRPDRERVEPMSYLDLQTMDDNVQGHLYRRYWKGHYFRELGDDAIHAFLMRGTDDGHGERLPGASLQAYGGAIAEVGEDATAFSHRDTTFEYVCASRWDDPAEDADRIGAARRYAGSLAPYAIGQYVNTITDEGVGRAYTDSKLARLTALKDRYDPDNVFHLNHNIAPTPR